jgi:CheY-like chemotaxis protein
MGESTVTALASLVLVVDDDRDNRESLASLLRHHGFAADVAGDGNGALDKAHAQRPAAIILDLVMPQLSGYDVLARLRDDERTRDIPVICLTGYQQSREKVLAAGFAEFLLKPARPADVLRALGRLLPPTSRR